MGDSDRGTIRSEVAAADAGLQSNIDTEAYLRQQADAAEIVAREAYEAFANNGRITLYNKIVDEETRAEAAESVLDSRLDTVEGGSSVIGSIAKAQADAQSFTTIAVSNEANSRTAADAILQSQIDAISDAVQYKGYVNDEGRIFHKDVTHANHNKLFENASFEDGDFYRMSFSASTYLTITFGDSSEQITKGGDSLVALNSVGVGAGVASDFHNWNSTESADIIREGMLDDTTIEKNGGSVRVKPNSIDRSSLSADVEADIDDKVSKTQPTEETSTGNTHIVITDDLGGELGTQLKHTSLTSSNTDAPNGTQRMFLEIHKVYSGGNGDPTDGSKAVVRTQEMEYHGDCNDFSQILTVDNAELNYHNSNAKTLGTSRISRTSGAHLGISTAHTASAEGSLLQNIGNLAHAQAIGVSSDVGEHGVLSDYDLEQYAQWLALNPLAVEGAPLDAAVVGDARTATSGFAVVGLGRPSYFDLTKQMTIPSSKESFSTDSSPVTRGDIKSNEFSDTFSIGSDTTEVINHGLDSKKIIVQITLDDEVVTSSFGVKMTSDNSVTITNTTEESLTGLEICIYKLSI